MIIDDILFADREALKILNKYNRHFVKKDLYLNITPYGRHIQAIHKESKQSSLIYSPAIGLTFNLTLVIQSIEGMNSDSFVSIEYFHNRLTNDITMRVTIPKVGSFKEKLSIKLQPIALFHLIRI